MSNTEGPNSARLRLLESISREFEIFKQALAPASDPISAMLRAHLFTEQVLEAHIRSWLSKPEDLLKQRLSYRVKLECRVPRSSAVAFSTFSVSDRSGKRAVPDWAVGAGIRDCF